MSDQQEDRTNQRAREDIDMRGTTQRQRSWEPPTLVEFIKPKLTRHGPLERLTGFFGSFSP